MQLILARSARPERYRRSPPFSFPSSHLGEGTPLLTEEARFETVDGSQNSITTLPSSNWSGQKTFNLQTSGSNPAGSAITSVVFLTLVSLVIPGRALFGASPESITTSVSWRYGCGGDLHMSSAWGYGFRARLRAALCAARSRPGMTSNETSVGHTTLEHQISLDPMLQVVV